jgi:hypothetical protein
MEPHQKKDITSEDMLSTQHGDGTTSVLSNNSEKHVNILKGKQDNIAALGATSELNQVDHNDERRDNINYNTGHTVSVNADKHVTTPRTPEDSNTLGQPLSDTTTTIGPVPHPVELPGDAHADSTTSTPLRDLIQDKETVGTLEKEIKVLKERDY